ncbi:hydantoinase/oxoprolinase family protein [Geoalkalibacter halelectricus]|uniref:Hydantoinase/oxoprolinase family protein n=1 Tax=Geoalkalibacter halelectricus TaxID=2847045 RepID=A0ABY5ZGF1_9BACT|nr:hydantoinase/oxoprolinase family protein [Geoalkalibacter halelectricus]MDO3380189.1 hydantoinase/oxoprolinase family protein [Geoalkalibacter halelectricus]UWZ78238.1 hydantoinase/oxoprolinase family protein [Geoalkalibacter halelectricus]
MKKSTDSLPLIGVDTGGTFTDLVLLEGERVRTWKLPSTPGDPSRAVLDGIRHLLGDRPAVVCHGSTVATNALLEGKGAPVALVVTQGFRDLLLIGRQNRPELYALHPRRPLPLVRREHVVEVRERITAEGEVEIALDDAEITRVVEAVRAIGCPSAALCLLHSYLRPDHEQALAAALEAAGLRVSASHRILPEYREFERASTTAVNAAVAPVMSRYLSRLQQGFGGVPLRIMQSNGGIIKAERAGAEAVRTFLSGPAGGMVGAFATAKAAGCERLITFDMGGTSTDVSLCDGDIPLTSETVLAGWPLKVPMIDIHTVGAGGGSIARLDAGGALRVGPRSAGADPGPACYGRGTEVTVTDANLYLGRLLPDHFLGGRMRLHVERCRNVIEDLARAADLPPQRLAEGVVEVVEATMAGALRVVSVARGYDPRNFTLLPFGGAGGLHACALADKLAIPRILIPVHPGLLSAVGLVLADTVRDYSLSILRPGHTPYAELRDQFAPLNAQAKEDMAAEGWAEDALVYEYSCDVRYRGQSFEVNVPFGEHFHADFHARHETLYGYRDDARAVEVVTLRLRAIGRGPHPDITYGLCREGELRPLLSTPVHFAGHTSDWPVYAREELPCGARFSGPALVVEETATHLIAPGWRAGVDRRGNLLLDRAGRLPS